MKDSLKEKILTFLEGKDFTFGGTIEDHIRATEGNKASNASRRCRELEDEGKLEAKYVKVGGRKVVQYRLTSTPQYSPVTREIYKSPFINKQDYCCFSSLKFTDKDGRPLHDNNCEVKKRVEITKTPEQAATAKLF